MTWGAVGASVVGGVVASRSASSQRKAAAQAQQQAQQGASPYNVRSLMGGVDFRTDQNGQRTMSMSLDPRLQSLYWQQLGQAGAGPSDQLNQLSRMQRTEGSQAMGMGNVLGRQGQQVSDMGMGLFQQGAMTDPNQIAQQQMQREMALLQPFQAAQGNQMQAQLFNQGLLGSTAGQGQMESLFSAQQGEQMDAARRSLAGGLDYTGQLFGRGMQGMQAGTGLQQASLGATGTGLGMYGQAEGAQDITQQRQMQALQAAMSLGQIPQGLAQIGAGAGSGQGMAGVAGADMGLQGNLAAAGQQAAFGQGLAGMLSGMSFGGGAGAGTQPTPGGGVGPMGSFGGPAGAEGTGFQYL